MVVAEFLFIAFVVGIMTKTWLGFLGAFLGLYALHRFTRLSALLSFVLSLYWGLLGFHLGASVGGVVAGAVLAVTVFVVALGVHRAGFPAVTPQESTIDDVSPADVAADPRLSPYRAQPSHSIQGEIIDAEYRVVS